MSKKKIGTMMSGRLRRFELVNKTTAKFATIEVDGRQLTTRKGAIGKDGRTTTKQLATPEAALAAYARIIESDLLLKHYVEEGKASTHFVLAVRELPKLSQAEQSSLADAYRTLVPTSGQASTIHGELFRCVQVLREEALRGNEGWERGHRMMLDFLHTHFLSRCFSFTRKDDPVGTLLDVQAASGKRKSATKAEMKKLESWVLCWCRAHPELIPHIENPKLHV